MTTRTIGLMNVNWAYIFIKAMISKSKLERKALFPIPKYDSFLGKNRSNTKELRNFIGEIILFVGNNANLPMGMGTLLSSNSFNGTKHRLYINIRWRERKALLARLKWYTMVQFILPWNVSVPWMDTFQSWGKDEEVWLYLFMHINFPNWVYTKRNW